MLSLIKALSSYVVRDPSEGCGNIDGVGEESGSSDGEEPQDLLDEVVTGSGPAPVKDATLQLPLVERSSILADPVPVAGPAFGYRSPRPRLHQEASPDTDSELSSDGNQSEEEIETFMRSEHRATGQITVMEPGMTEGLVDGSFKFNIAKFQSKEFRVYDRVEFNAEQLYSDGCLEWIITSMERFVHPRLKEIHENKRFSTSYCTVKAINSSLGEIAVENSDIIQVMPKRLVDFDVVVGDKLEVHSEAGGEPVRGSIPLNKVWVKPTRKAVRRGYITMSCKDFAVFGSDIIILSPAHCEGAKFPAVGSYVRVEYIESDQVVNGQEFKLRAVSVAVKAKACPEDEENSKLTQLLRDKCGVLVKPMDKVRFPHAQVGGRIDAQLTISNTSAKVQYLHQIRINNDQAVCRFTVTCAREADDIVTAIEPGREFLIKITCEPQHLGRTLDFCTLDFKDFKIGRELCVRVLPLERETFKQLTENRSSTRTVHRRLGSKRRETERTIQPFSSTDRPRVQGIPTVRTPFFLPTINQKSPSYRIPDFIVQSQEQNVVNILFEHLPTIRFEGMPINLTLTPENYKEMLHAALWFEELHHLKRKQMYSLKDVVMERTGDYFSIPFPGVRDAFPTFIPGDPLNICDANDPKGAIYHAEISRIGDDHIIVKLSGALFASYDGKPMSVEFTIGRTSYKRCHFAVDNAMSDIGLSCLFPSGPLVVQHSRIPFLEDGEEPVLEPPAEPRQLRILKPKLHKVKGSRSQRPLDRRAPSLRPLPQIAELTEVSGLKEVTLRWYNQSLNTEQKEAVKRVVRGAARPLPYIIFGPPGTGKTVTVVEAVTQINKLDKNSRILVTAPSNAAADLIATYLVEICKYRLGEFVRLLGYNRMDSPNVPDIIKDYCKDGDELEEVLRHRIIVSTCNSAGLFFQFGKLSALHISHVFIDEAGYCHEPDSLIPALFVSCNPDAQIILAGDPKQLGPIVFDDSAAYYGLKNSLLERLMDLPLYKKSKKPGEVNGKGTYDPVLVTKLIRNYRAHRDLLTFSSKTFYDDELVASARPEETDNLCQLPFLPKKGLPLIFHGLRGDEAQDSDSPSRYNAMEVMEVVKYVRSLLESGCCTEDIGIISPYRKQVEKIRQGITKEIGCRLPKVGSVEEFQGGEKRIIILSLVRSLEEEAETETLDRLSFVFNKKRLNVSATRAKALFITIGNPILFSAKQVWKRFIRHCIVQGAYTGCNLPPCLSSYQRKAARAQDDYVPVSGSDDESDRAGSDADTD